MWPALLGAGLGLVGGWLGGRGSSGGSSGNAAQYLGQIAPMAKEQFNPYIERGHKSQDLASAKYDEMAANPMDYINQIISGYKPSEGYKFREQKALEAARNSAAAGGFSGTRNDQLQQAEMANGLLGQDMQEWLNNVLGIQGTGLAGQQHIADRGFNASQNLADLLAQGLGAQASLAYEDKKEKRANRQALFGGLANLAQMGLGGLAGGAGGALGGGIGGILGGLGGGGSGGGNLGGGLSLESILGGAGLGLGKNQPRGPSARGFGGAGSNPVGGFRGSIYGGGRG